MDVNRPAVLAEMQAAFVRYEAALTTNDVAVLDGRRFRHRLHAVPPRDDAGQARPPDAELGADAGGLARGGGACKRDRGLILLVRHPPVDAGGRCYGRLDLPVADPASVAELAGRIAAHMPVRDEWTVWTSPAQRCRLVAEALGAHQVDGRLQEMDFGAWEGVAWDDVPRASLDAWAADPWAFAPPLGESGAMLVARVRGFAAGCVEGHHVVLTHGGPLKVMRAVLRHTAVDLLAAAPPPGSHELVGHPGG